MAKATFNKKRVLFTSILDLKLKKKLVKCYIWSIAFYMLKLGYFKKQSRHSLEVSKCGPGRE